MINFLDGAIPPKVYCIQEICPHPNIVNEVPMHLISGKTCTLLLVTVVILGLLSPAMADESTAKHKKSFFGTVVGIGLVAGGSVYSVLEHNRAEALYSRYHRSAFTDNTDRLRNDVKQHDRNSAIGILFAGLGAFAILVNF